MDRIRVGIVGLNFGRQIVEEIARGAAGEYVELAAVCDLDEEKARAMGAREGVPAYGKLEDLLADDSIPAVGLFTGPVGRADLIRAIIRAGRDVMTTKPFELDPDAALTVLHEAREAGRVVHMNSPGPEWPEDLATIQTWRREHELGRPIGCRTSVWVRYHERTGTKGSWYDDPRQCPVAPVFRLGIYHINDMVRLMGEAARVQVFGSRIFTGRPTADNGLLSILFKNGAIGSVYASFCVEDGDKYRNSMTLNFEKGTVYRNCGPYRKSTFHHALELGLVMAGDETGRRLVEEKLVEKSVEGYQWDAFRRAVRGEALRDEIAPEQIVAALRIIEAMSKADQGNGTADVLPVC